MKKITLYSCPLCHCRNIANLDFLKDHFVSKESFELFECQDCNFRFTQSFPDETVIAPYYNAEEYISHSDTKKGLVNSIYHAVRSYMLGQKVKLMEKYSFQKKGKLLDIGSGTGYFLHQASVKGWKTKGIEKSDDARKKSIDMFDLDVESEDYFQKIEENSYDVITLWHVLEHIQDLDSAIETIEKGLCFNGLLLIAVPNWRSFDGQYYQTDWAAYDVPRHLWHFSPESFSPWIESKGFVLEKIKPMYFDAFYISMMSERYRGSKSPFIKGFIMGTLAFIYTVFNKKRGSSLIYVLRKRSNNREIIL